MTQSKADPAVDPTAPETELTGLLARRGSVRNFRPDPVPEDWARAIVENGMRAPTSSNRQEYSIVRVDDPAKRTVLAGLCGDQKHIEECPLFLALCADQNRLSLAIEMHGKSYAGFGMEGGLVATIDATLVGLTMSYVAESFGLSSVLIGAVRNKPLEVARLLELPPRAYVVFGLCIGWARVPPLPKPRHDPAAVLHRDRYDPAAHDAAVRAYDKALADYYRDRGIETPDAAWSEVLGNKLATPRRPNLRAELRELGFPFE